MPVRMEIPTALLDLRIEDIVEGQELVANPLPLAIVEAAGRLLYLEDSMVLLGEERIIRLQVFVPWCAQFTISLVGYSSMPG
jgi:hypothetical protein